MPEMTNKKQTENDYPKFSRRIALAGVCFAMLSQKASAAIGAGSAVASSPAPDPKDTFSRDSEADGMVEIAEIHRGKGKVKTKFFRFDDASAPAHFIVYDLPPGASEGIHAHFLDDRNKQGSFDEYYYFISGQGQMEIDDEIVAVAKGDHIHTPLEVAHGVENTHPTESLRVFLTFIKRGNERPQMPRSAPTAAT
jgi:mannose-6-phosphate isomerase-like protein (cupin superfamily)